MPFMWGRVTQVKREEKAGRGGTRKMKTPTGGGGVSVRYLTALLWPTASFILHPRSD